MRSKPVGVTIVVGGQFGSEGKGKVAHHWAEQTKAAAVVRVGGPNSGHTVVLDDGTRWVLRQLPVAALAPDTACIIAAGSYLDLEVLAGELERLRITPERLSIDPNAVIISEGARTEEARAGLRERIGSTLSGTGAAVLARAARGGEVLLARDHAPLAPYLVDTHAYMRKILDRGGRIIVEGTQGFGLSVLHSPLYPYATARDTTAAGALAEVGLSPMDVDEVVMVLRSFPIRVAGNSGPLTHEIGWPTIREEGSHDHDLTEWTTVTKRIRRVGRFDASLVEKAMVVNHPTHIVLNHVDYVDHDVCLTGALTGPADEFVRDIERRIGQHIGFVGIAPNTLIERPATRKPLRVARGA